MLTARIHAFEESSHGTLQSSLGSLMHDRPEVLLTTGT